MSARSSACRIGMVSQDEARITFASKSTAEPVVTCSGGSVAQTAMDDRYDTGGLSLAVSTITITGLVGATRYTYSITQGSDVINGSFKTMPNAEDNFSFIVASCDYPERTSAQNPWALIRTLMEDADYPLIAMFHIDDVSYVDITQVNDGVYISTGDPSTTGLGSDYAINWANYYGLIAGGGGAHACAKFAHPDRHHVYQNLPSFVSAGDHGVAPNHCRGPYTDGVPDNPAHSCDRSPGGLEEVAKGEWDAFLGNANPDPLRVDKWHWGTQIGSVKFALFDYSLYSVPYDSTLNTDAIGYGAEQIADITAYMSDPDVQWKCFLMESGPTTHGQPWLNWHATEAGDWKTAFDADDNLNGVIGNSFVAHGDTHFLCASSYDTFWNFTAGLFNGSPATGGQNENEIPIADMAASWGGQHRFTQATYDLTGRRLLGGFWHFKVTGTTSIEATCYSASGAKFVKGITLAKNATDNQWTMGRNKFS